MFRPITRTTVGKKMLTKSSIKELHSSGSIILVMAQQAIRSARRRKFTEEALDNTV